MRISEIDDGAYRMKLDQQTRPSRFGRRVPAIWILVILAITLLVVKLPYTANALRWRSLWADTRVGQALAKPIEEKTFDDPEQLAFVNAAGDPILFGTKIGGVWHLSDQPGFGRAGLEMKPIVDQRDRDEVYSQVSAQLQRRLAELAAAEADRRAAELAKQEMEEKLKETARLAEVALQQELQRQEKVRQETEAKEREAARLAEAARQQDLQRQEKLRQEAEAKEREAARLAEVARQQELQRQEKVRQEEARKQEAERQRIAELEYRTAHVRDNVLKNEPQTIEVAVMFTRKGAGSDAKLAGIVMAALKAGSLRVADNVLKEVVATDGTFDNLCQEDAKQFERLELIRFTDHLVLGQSSVEFKGPFSNGVVKAVATLEVRVVSAKTGLIESRFSIESQGVGLSKEKAEDNAREDLAAKLSKQKFESLN